MKHRTKSTCAHQVVSSSPGRHGVSTRLSHVQTFRESPLYSSAWLSARLKLVGFVFDDESRQAITIAVTLLPGSSGLLDSELHLVLTRLTSQYKGHQGPVSEAGLACG